MSTAVFLESVRGSRNGLVGLFRQFIVCLVVLATIATPAAAGETEVNVPGSDHRPVQGDDESLTIPARLPDGRPIRTIGLYQAQIELVPENFLPISIDRLITGISNLTPRATDEDRNRLSSAVYWIDIRDGVLVSRRSEITIDSDSDAIVRRSLGQVNLAIESPESLNSMDAIGAVPRLENQSNGDLVAVFGGGKNQPSKIPFRWQLLGTSSSSGYDFDMHLPRTAQTRVVLSTQPGIEVEALDGVLRRRAGPPPDAGNLQSDDRRRWYELDAGGLDRIRIRTRQKKAKKTVDPWIIRSRSAQYEVDPTGLNWICHMQVQSPKDGQFPMIQYRRATVSRVIVNSIDVPFTSVVRGTRRNIRIESPEGDLDNQSGLTTITISGTSAFQSNSQWIDLPLPLWLGKVEVAATVDQVQLLVPKTLELEKWLLPDEWTRQSPQTVDNGSLVYSASGPFANPQIRSRPNREKEKAKSIASWSRVRFVRPTLKESAQTTLRIELTEESLTARARLAVQTDPDGFAPFRIRVEPNWNIETVTFRNSSRVIEKPRVPESGVIALWPEAEEMEAGKMVLDIVGTRVPNPNASRLTIPATWFVAPTGIPDDRIAAIVRPDGLGWARDALLQNEQITASDVTDAAEQFLGVVAPDTLLFRPIFGRTPVVSLKMPIASFDAVTQFYVSRDRDEIVERLDIEIRSSGKRLREMVVQSGPNEGRPPIVWSLGDEMNSPEIRLPKSAVTVGEGEQEGLYTISLNDQNLSGQRLFGRRRYRVNSQQLVTLPSVPAATSARSYAWIGPGLSVGQIPPDVYAILVAPETNSITSTSPKDFYSGTNNLQDAIGLRYDQTRSAMISLSKSKGKKHVAIVRREQVKIVASSRGVDRIEATYTLAPSTQPLRIQYEPNLRLVSMYRDNSAVVLESVPQKYVTIPPRSEPEVVRLTWNRDQYENRWVRSCTVPRISISGIVLKSEYELVPASDAFAPVALMESAQTNNGQYSSISLQPGASVTLIRRNVVLASGWLLAMLAFAIAWLVARRSTLVLAFACLILLAAILLWWPWKMAMIGWLIVPIVSAAMLATSIGPSRNQKSLATRSATTAGDLDPAVGGSDASNDFSVETVFRILPWAMILVAVSTTTLVAQTPPSIASGLKTNPEREQISSTVSDNRSGPAINILVPVDKQGDRVGETIYVHDSVHKQITHPKSNGPKSVASFQSADYRIRIDRNGSPGKQQDDKIVEAMYRIHFEEGQSGTNTVRLPFAGSSVRRIELLGKRYRLIRFDAEAPNSVIAYLPRGDAFQIRVTLIAQSSHTEAWNKLTLPIPRVSASHLTVESDHELARLRIGGELVSELDRQRWSIAIGPQDQFVIEYPSDRKPLDKETDVLKRRYLVDIGRRIVSIDCQLDPPRVLSSGETYRFIARGDLPRLVRSKRWELKKTELLGSARRRLTVVANHDEPGPIHLHWSQPINSKRSEAISPTEISIPEVTADGSTTASNAWVGLRCDPALQFAPLIGEGIEPLSVDQFNAQWKGRLVKLDRAYVGINGIPNPVVQHKSLPQSTITQRHHLHVTADRLELTFNATLQPTSATSVLYCLRLPGGVYLQSLMVDGQDRAIHPSRYPDYLEFPLQDISGSRPIEIQATAILPITTETKFSPPSMSVTDTVVTSDDYFISRVPSIAVQAAEGSQTQYASLPTEIAVDWLRRGWSPVVHWKSSLNDPASAVSLGSSPRLDEIYQIKGFPIEFDCRQVIAIDRDDRGWMMEANIHFDSDQMPDVIDVEAPRRWCKSLEVEGALQWVQLGEDNSPQQIIRIRYDKQSVSKRALTIRGRLQDTDTTRLSIPKFQVIGPGQRSVYINIPNRESGQEPILWQTSAVDSAVVPPELAISDWLNKPERSTFVAVNPSWSIDRQSLPDFDIEPIASLFDVNFFSQPDGALVHCRWDLFPGNLDSVDIRLHAGTTAMAAWSAGRAVEIHAFDSPSEQVDDKFQLIRIPLAVSRLSQPVELLLRVTSKSTDQGDYVPKLLDIPVMHSWLVQHVPAPKAERNMISVSVLSLGNPRVVSLATQRNKRQLAIANSVVDSIESTDRGFGQSQQEIAALSQIWLNKYRIVRNQVELESTTESVQTQWLNLDSRLMKVFQRQGIDPQTALADEQADTKGSVLLEFGNEELLGFEVESITALTGMDRPRLVSPVSSGDRGLKTLIANGLTIVLVAGILGCLIPLRKYVAPVTAHPAFWLGLLGIFGIAIAPLYVAAALILLAIALPVFPAKRQVSDPVG